MVGASVSAMVASSSVLASLSKSLVVESDALVGAETEWVMDSDTVSVEDVGLGTVPWYVDVTSAVELVADVITVVVAITGVVFDMSVAVALALVLEIVGLGVVDQFLAGVDSPPIDVLNIFSKESSLFISSRVLSWFSLCFLCLVLDLSILSFIMDKVCLFRSDPLDLISIRCLFLSMVAGLCFLFCVSLSFLGSDRCCEGDEACILLGDPMGLLFVGCFFTAFVACVRFSLRFGLFFWGLDGLFWTPLLTLEKGVFEF